MALPRPDARLRPPTTPVAWFCVSADPLNTDTPLTLRL